MSRADLLKRIKVKESEVEERLSRTRQKADTMVMDARQQASRIIEKARRDSEEEERKAILQARQKAEAEGAQAMEREKAAFDVTFSAGNPAMTKAVSDMKAQFLNTIESY
jgi:vacuolar-type H+-ATPase subunit H